MCDSHHCVVALDLFFLAVELTGTHAFLHSLVSAGCSFLSVPVKRSLWPSKCVSNNHVGTEGRNRMNC